MTAPTDQFVDIAKRSQEAVTTAVRNWADSVQSFAGNLTTGHTQLPDPLSVVGGYFDFAEKVLEVQREFVKNLTSATVSVGQAVRHHAQSTGQAVRNQAESTGQLIREHNDMAAKAATDAVAKAVTEKIAEKYGDWTKADLQDELARRDLPKTGNVEELRTRLDEDDQK